MNAQLLSFFPALPHANGKDPVIWQLPGLPQALALAAFASKQTARAQFVILVQLAVFHHAGPLQAALSFQLLHGISAQPGGDGHTSPVHP